MKNSFYYDTLIGKIKTSLAISNKKNQKKHYDTLIGKIKTKIMEERYGPNFYYDTLIGKIKTLLISLYLIKSILFTIRS